jgi:hypothetical protein
MSTGEPVELEVILIEPDQLFGELATWLGGSVPPGAAASTAPAAVGPPAPGASRARPRCDEVSAAGHFEVGNNEAGVLEAEIGASYLVRRLLK